MNTFKHWDVVAMCIAMAVVFGFEMLGVFTSRYVTITAIVRAYMPLWARGMVIGWLAVHFLIQK